MWGIEKQGAENGLFGSVRLTILARKIDYLGVQDRLFWSARLTVLERKIDCFGVRDGVFVRGKHEKTGFRWSETRF